MSAVYVESSAVLSWFFEEAHARDCARVFNETETLVTSVLTGIEVRRALVRGVHSGAFRESAGRRLLGAWESTLQTWALVEMTPSVQERAGQAFPVEPVRALDALHLASVLDLIPVFPDLKVLSLDRRILDNLPPLGLVSAL